MDALWISAAALIFLASCLRPIGNPDLFWHLSAGRDILNSGAVPRTEVYSFTRSGSPWVDFEWLTQVLYVGIEARAGFWGLIGFKTLLLLGVAFCLERILTRQRVPAPARAGAICFLAAGLSVANDVRPENISLLLFAVEWLVLDGIRPAAASSSRALGGSALFFSLWANCHGGFAAGLALLGCHAAGAWLSGSSRTVRRFYGSCLAAAVLGSLANPYGWKIYSVIADHLFYSAELSEVIVEWFPTGLANAGHWPFWILLAAALVTVALPRLRRELLWVQILALAGLAFAALGHNRQTPFFVLASLSCLPGVWWKADSSGSADLKRSSAFGAGGGAAVLTLLFMLRFAPFTFPREPLKPLFPERMVEFLRRHEGVFSDLRMYNPWGWGGYMGRALGPRFRVFIDGRYIFHGLLMEENKATASPQLWQEFIARYRFDMLVLKRDLSDMTTTRMLPGGRVEKEPRPYYLFFIPQDRWSLVYWDRLAMVFARKEAVPRSWLDGHEYSVLHPGDIKALRRALAAGRLPRTVLLKEICRHGQESGFDPEAEELLGAMGPSSCL